MYLYIHKLKLTLVIIKLLLFPLFVSIYYSAAGTWPTYAIVRSFVGFLAGFMLQLVYWFARGKIRRMYIQGINKAEIEINRFNLASAAQDFLDFDEITPDIFDHGSIAALCAYFPFAKTEWVFASFNHPSSRSESSARGMTTLGEGMEASTTYSESNELEEGIYVGNFRITKYGNFLFVSKRNEVYEPKFFSDQDESELRFPFVRTIEVDKELIPQRIGQLVFLPTIELIVPEENIGVACGDLNIHDLDRHETTLCRDPKMMFFFHNTQRNQTFNSEDDGDEEE